MTGGVHIASEPVRSEVEAAGPAGRPVPTRERLLVGAASALFLHLVLFRGVTPIFPFAAGSNGVFFDEGLRILNGEVMYRDFFEFLAPGISHLHALIFLVAGPRVGALGYAMVALGSALAVLIHALSALLMGSRWRLLPPAAFVVLVYAPYTLGDHKWPALAFGFLGLIVLGSQPLTKNVAVAGGFLLGASAVFTQDLGIGLVVGAVVFFALRRSPAASLVALCLACSAPLVLALGFFALQAGFRTVVYDVVLFPLDRYPELNRAYLDLIPSVRTLPREAAQILLAGGGLLGAVALLRNRTEPPRGRLDPDPERLVASAGLGMLAALGHRGLFPMGLAVQASVLIPVMARALEIRWHSATKLRLLYRGALAILAVGLLHGSVGFALWRQFFQPMTEETHRAGRIWAPTPMPELFWIERNTAPGEGTFLLPAKCGHHFLSHTRSVTSFPYLIEGQNTPEQARKALAEIEAALPAVGVWDQRGWRRSSPQTSGPLAALYEGIMQRYDAERLPSGVLLLRRKDRATPGASIEPESPSARDRGAEK